MSKVDVGKCLRCTNYEYGKTARVYVDQERKTQRVGVICAKCVEELLVQLEIREENDAGGL